MRWLWEQPGSNHSPRPIPCYFRGSYCTVAVRRMSHMIGHRTVPMTEEAMSSIVPGQLNKRLTSSCRCSSTDMVVPAGLQARNVNVKVSLREGDEIAVAEPLRIVQQ